MTTNEAAAERLALPREEVAKAIECRNPARVPMMIHQWTYPAAYGEREREVREILSRYPNDMFTIIPRMPAKWDERSTEQPTKYSWLNMPPPAKGDVVAHDANIGIRDWDQLDDILAQWPDVNVPWMYTGAADNKRANAAGRYTALHFWYCLYERLWDLRGMENILCDFYENPDKIHRLMDALTDFYCGVIQRGAKEVGADAIYTTDDIGMQTGPMFSPDIFREFFKPRYAKLAKTAHACGLHFWLHTCGDVRLFLDDLIEVGVDVIHPIQKYTMPEKEIASTYGGRICFWAGMDVQHTLPRGTPEDVRREVRFLIDTYDRPDGGCMITCGNGVTPDIPPGNLEAFLDETYRYGTEHRRRFS